MATQRAILVVILVRGLRALSKDHSWGDPKGAPEGNPESDPGDNLEGDPEGGPERNPTVCKGGSDILIFGISLPRHLS